MCFKRTYTEHIHKQEEGSFEWTTTEESGTGPVRSRFTSRRHGILWLALSKQIANHQRRRIPVWGEWGEWVEPSSSLYLLFCLCKWRNTRSQALSTIDMCCDGTRFNSIVINILRLIYYGWASCVFTLQSHSPISTQNGKRFEDMTFLEEIRAMSNL